jgi:hypothetical protein
MRNYGALYGKGTAVVQKPRKKRRRDEEVEQEKFFVWLDQNGIIAFHPRNGGSLNPIEGAKFKRLGVKRGVPDVCLPLVAAPYHGLYIELKKIDGKLSDLSEEQAWWLKFLQGQGYKAEVAFGFLHAKQIVEEYLKCTANVAMPNL